MSNPPVPVVYSRYGRPTMKWLEVRVFAHIGSGQFRERVSVTLKKNPKLRKSFSNMPGAIPKFKPMEAYDIGLEEAAIIALFRPKKAPSVIATMLSQFEHARTSGEYAAWDEPTEYDIAPDSEPPPPEEVVEADMDSVMPNWGDQIFRNGKYADLPTKPLDSHHEKTQLPTTFDQERELRKWQEAGLSQIVDEAQTGSDTAVVCSCPASGKTFFALMATERVKQLKYDGCLTLVLTPRVGIKRGWINEARLMGITLTPSKDGREFIPSQGEDMFSSGYVMTYQEASRATSTLYAFCKKYKPIVILDEIHHASTPLGERRGNVWGASIENALSSSSYKLMLTGTPFREGRNPNPISFVRYDSHNRVIATVNYTYAEAIADNVCRPVEFKVWAAKFIQRDAEDVEVEIEWDTPMSRERAAQRLNAAISDTGGFVKPVLIAAHKKLLQVRLETGRENAGGLVVAKDQNHASRISALLTEITGVEPTLVQSRIPDSMERINTFRNDANKLWIVGVNMLSEGVDIPRLSVGVFCTNIQSRLYFRQFIGRLARRTQTPDDELGIIRRQFSHIYIPGDREIRSNAKDIYDEVLQAVGKDVDPYDGSLFETTHGLLEEMRIEVVEAYEESIILDGINIPSSWWEENQEELLEHKKDLPDRLSDMLDSELAIWLVKKGLLPPFDQEETTD